MINSPSSNTASNPQKARKATSLPDSSSPDCHGHRKATTVTELRPHDVIMGRGLQASEYQGNRRLRQMVQSRRQAYVDANSREGKQRIAQEIIAAIRVQGGRFLRKHVAFMDGQTKSAWQTIDDPEEMISKVKQLLRDMAPEVKERRVQRRRRQAEWARQNAHTTLFPDVAECPFLGEGLPPPAPAVRATASVPSSAPPESQETSPLPPSLAVSLNSRLQDHSLQQLIQALPTSYANASSVGSSTGSLLQDQVQQLLLLSEQGHQQQQQEQAHFQRALQQQWDRVALPTAQSMHPTTPSITDPRTTLLELLQRHAGATPRMTTSPLTNNNNNSSTQRLLWNPLNAALARYLPDSNYNNDSVRTPTTSATTTNSNVSIHALAQAIASSTASPDLRNLSEEELARLVVLEHLQNALRR